MVMQWITNKSIEVEDTDKSASRQNAFMGWSNRRRFELKFNNKIKTKQ